VKSSIRAARHGEVLLLSLENLSGYPRLERAVLSSLAEQIGVAIFEASIHGIVLSGTERVFAAGAEIRELTKMDAVGAHEFSRFGQEVMARIERSPKPIIAAIRGYCLGGGLDLALACHARIASEDARFAHPGAALGILTGWGGTQRLTRVIGRGRALEMFTTGDVMSAARAFDIGLVSEVLPSTKVIARGIQLAKNRDLRC
jgi:enoyl-CoA hydratase